MKGYETEGENPWETIPDTVPFKTKTYEGAAQPAQSVIQPDYPATAEMQALRDDSEFIGWGTPVVDEENRVITITAKDGYVFKADFADTDITQSLDADYGTFADGFDASQATKGTVTITLSIAL